MKLDVTHAAAPVAAPNPQPVARNDAPAATAPSDFAAKVRGEDTPVSSKPEAAPPPASKLETVLEPQRIFAEIRARFDAAIAPLRARRAELEKAGIRHTDPRWRDIGEEHDRLLLDMQMEVHAAAARIEMFGKLVEHTTSSVRTVAQTQV